MIEPTAENPSMNFVRPEIHHLQDYGGREALSDGEVHVWSFLLDAESEVQCRCAQWLSPSEKERASRFILEEHRTHFVVAHGCLRQVLSRYCNREPSSLQLVQTFGEKPKLISREAQQRELFFNLAHSHGRGVIAVANGFDVGIDLEQVRKEIEYLKLTERYFARSEYDFITREQGEHQRLLFFRHWVGKEAVLKGRGIGLRYPLSGCQLVMSDEHDQAVVHWLDRSAGDTQWLIRFLALDSGWVGAVAAEGTNWTVSYRELMRP